MFPDPVETVINVPSAHEISHNMDAEHASNEANSIDGWSPSDSVNSETAQSEAKPGPNSTMPSMHPMREQNLELRGEASLSQDPESPSPSS